MFRAVLLSNQLFCKVFGRGDPQKVFPRSEVGRYLDGSDHKGQADLTRFSQIDRNMYFPFKKDYVSNSWKLENVTVTVVFPELIGLG